MEINYIYLKICNKYKDEIKSIYIDELYIKRLRKPKRYIDYLRDRKDKIELCMIYYPVEFELYDNFFILVDRYIIEFKYSNSEWDREPDYYSLNHIYKLSPEDTTKLNILNSQGNLTQEIFKQYIDNCEPII